MNFYRSGRSHKAHLQAQWGKRLDRKCQPVVAGGQGKSDEQAAHEGMAFSVAAMLAVTCLAVFAAAWAVIHVMGRGQ